MKDTGIYQIKSRSTGRLYIGSAVSIRKRWMGHKNSLRSGKHHSRFLSRCWVKYGEDDFEFKALVFCSKKDLLFYEQRFIDALSPEYNTSPTAGSQLGYKHSNETRSKLRAARARNNFGPRIGAILSKETKEKISKSKRGVKLGPRPDHLVKKVADAMRAKKSVLTEVLVKEAKAMLRDGRSISHVAKEIGCSYSAIADISRNKTFKWVA